VIALRPAPAIATSAADELAPVARRTRRLRIALALAALGLLALALFLARGAEARSTSYFATGGEGIVVFDLSTSVDPLKYQRVYRVLTALSTPASRIGLVVFSDSAYEMLPPGTRGEEIRPLLRFFRPPRTPPPPTTREQAREQPLPSLGIQSPWSGTFRGGTRISTGLREARLIAERDGIENPTVLLMSDLDDSAFDTQALTQELIRYQAEGLRLRIVGLFPQADDRDLFERLAGESTFVERTELLQNSELEERQTLIGDFPVAFTVAGAFLLLLLAINEHACRRLTWRAA
jgi:hypothetical protein